jgi:DNA-binding NarL/FixJ family response regulator
MLSEVRSYYRFEVEEAENSEETIAKVMSGDYDVVLMDYVLPGLGGHKTTEIILSRSPGVAVLGISYYDERSYVDRMVGAGAKGYILKNIEPDTLACAIKTVMGGKFFYSNEIALKLLETKPIRPIKVDALALLTPREKEVFRAIMGGMLDREIAEQLCIGKRTVDKHRQHLMAKLGARNAIELVQAGVRMGMVPGPGSGEDL